MPRNRSADASIRGYVYQFDRTILRILSSGPADTVTVEGIEDIDLRSGERVVAEQCKYLPASRYSLAVIRDALVPMLDYLRNGHSIEFVLYIHANDSGSTPPGSLSVEDIREALTVRRKNSDVTRLYETYDMDTLEEFSRRLSIVTGPSFASQRQEVIEALRSELKCTAEEAVAFYYPNALSVIASVAVKSSQVDRQISKAHFIADIDHRKFLYTTWHAEAVGREQFIDELTRGLKHEHRLKNEMRRCLAVSISDRDEVDSTAALIRMLASKYYGVGKLHTAIPWTIVIDADRETLFDLKVHLTESTVEFNDGNEAYGFNTELFNRRPIVERKGRSHLIAASSFNIWVVSLTSYSEALSSIVTPDIMLSHRNMRKMFESSVGKNRIVELGSLSVVDLTRVMERI
jgi:hypothetical protein